MKDEKAALLGDHEAARRLTEAGVLLACPFCKGHVRSTADMEHPRVDPEL